MNSIVKKIFIISIVSFSTYASSYKSIDSKYLKPFVTTYVIPHIYCPEHKVYIYVNRNFKAMLKKYNVKPFKLTYNLK